jgi:hypothetical protein
MPTELKPVGISSQSIESIHFNLKVDFHAKPVGISDRVRARTETNLCKLIYSSAALTTA